MSLIDWPSLVRNALWVLGLSIVLAAWSHMSWLAARRRVHAWRAIDWPVFAVPASLGLVSFAASLAWGATRTWERILWIVLAATFLAQAALAWRQARRQGWQPRLPEEASADSSDAASNHSARHRPNL